MAAIKILVNIPPSTICEKHADGNHDHVLESVRVDPNVKEKRDQVVDPPPPVLTGDALPV